MGIEIFVDGLKEMVRDFERLASGEPLKFAVPRLDKALGTAFAATQAAVPTDDGDYRRPAGALRDSGRATTGFEGDEWTGEIRYGTEDDALPYAVWAEWKHYDKTGEDYMGDPIKATEHEFTDAVNAYFDAVFPDR